MEVGVLAALLLVAFVLRRWVAAAIPVIETDGVQYVRIAEQFRASGIPWDPLFHPLYSVAMALAAPFAADLEAAGRLVSALFGTAVILPAYALARAILGPGAALITAGLLSIHPALVHSGASVLSEAIYTFWLILAVWIGHRAFTAERPRTLPAAGIALGLAYLVRPEAFLYLLGLLGWAVHRAVRVPNDRRFLRPLIFTGLGFIACAVPYWVYLRHTLGRWTLTGKVLHNLIQDTGRLPASDHTDLGYLADHAVPIAWHLVENSILLAKYVLPELFPGVLVLLLVPGVLAATRRSGWWHREGFLLLASVPPLATLAFHVEARVFLPVLPFLLPLVAAGILAAAQWAGRTPDNTRWLAATLAVVVLATLPFTLRPILRPDPDLVVYRRAALWLADRVSADALLLDRKPFLGFYGGRRVVPLPDIPPVELLALARRTGATIVVLDHRWLADRPKLWPLVYAPPPGGFRILQDFDGLGTRRLRLLEVIPDA
jgi:4-amino-4-deoxy-L-arabinose transferase-like glycosyltransferase